MIQWKIEKRKISSLKPHSKNPRKLSKHDAEHLQKSMEKFGLIDKPIINLDDTIIGGHQRISILKKQGIKEVEVFVPDKQLESKDADELNIRLNRATGEWDYDILANQWKLDDLLEWGFTEEELSININEIEPVEENNEVLEPGKDEDAITKIGDVFTLDRHILVCGDSTLPDVVNKCCNDKSPILMVTDPPYGVNYDPKWRIGHGGKAGKHIKSSGKVLNDDQVNWSLAWHLFPGSVVYVWHAYKFCSEVQKSIEEAGYEIISQIIWVKQNHSLSRGDYQMQHEPCWYAIRKGCNHNWQGSRTESTTWEIPSFSAFGGTKEEKTAHSTQKPLECMARPIRNNTAKGEGVYDPFLGSGTTLIAAESLDRICYGIELSPAYCDIIVQRWINYRKKQGKDYSVIKNGKPCEDFNG